MNELTVMTNGLFGDVRFAEVDGKPFAVANDIARVLGYVNPSDATNKYCKNSIKVWGRDSLGRRQEFKAIPEGDIYRLIARSKLPKAEEFESWVFDEVIPQIRQTGGYIPVTEDMSDEEIMAKALLVANKTIEKKNVIIKEQAEKIEYLEDKLVLTQKQTNMLVSALKARFCQIHGSFGWAADERFQFMKSKIFDHFKVNKWSEINQRDFYNALKYIDGIGR